MVPKVLNKRVSGIPVDAVYVGRPTIYGNPYTIEEFGREKCIALYRDYALGMMQHKPIFRDAVIDLRGKDLVCWCAPEACHADILLELANS